MTLTILDDEIYKGWRVLSKGVDADGNQYINLISAGIPLNYYIEYNEADEVATDLIDNFLIVPYDENGFSNIDLSEVFNNQFTSSVRSINNLDIDDLAETMEAMSCIFGVRPVVTLKSNVKFKLSDEKINNTTTWEISL